MHSVMVWIVLILGLILLALGALSLAGVFDSLVVRIIGGVFIVLLGGYMTYWSVQELRRR